MSKDTFTEGNVGTLVCDDPLHLNVMKKDAFLKRAQIVFQGYEDVLKETLGAYGSPTIISNYPYRTVTKDGCRVCRNIEDHLPSGSDVDKVIGNIILSISERLNSVVGDGTTTAVVAANQTFKAFNENMDFFKNYRPKEIMEKFMEVKEDIIRRLEKMATPITKENLSTEIEKIVRISVNDDKTLADLIVKGYKEIGFPAITCETSDTSDTYIDIIDGYRAKVHLGDGIYVNNENAYAQYRNVDVLIFSHKVTIDTYDCIITPLNRICKALKRKLVCIAPWYDDRLIKGKIRRDITTEYENEGEANLVICNIFTSNDLAKQQLNDLAMILGTTIIDSDLEDEIIEKTNTVAIDHIINIHDRGIKGIGVFQEIIDEDGNRRIVGQLVEEEGQIFNQERLDETIVNLGHADRCTLAKNKSSIFKNSHYNEGLYKKSVEEAERVLEETIHKYEILGTYTRDVFEAQNRVALLKMKFATIYVGGDTDMKRGMLLDMAEDGIRAAESAYRFGYVQGCSTSIIHAIDEWRNEDNKEEDDLKDMIYQCLRIAFLNVYEKVLENAFGVNFFVTKGIYNPLDVIVRKYEEEYKIHTNPEELKELILTHFGVKDRKSFEEIVPEAYDLIDLTDLLTHLSITKGKVFDLDVMDFSDNVINSVKTDIEVLTAVTDLLSTLIVGNQVLLASWNHSHQY